MTTNVIRIALLLGFASSGLAQQTGFRYASDLAIPEVERDELVAARLNEQVFQATDDDLHDVRLLDDQASSVPFVIRRARTMRTRTTRTSWTAVDPRVRPLDDGGLEIMVELQPDDPSPDGLRIVSPLRNFQQQIRVDSSDDGSQWQPLVEGAVIFDYSQWMDVRRDSIPLKDIENRQFRLVIDAVTSTQESQLLELTRRLRGGDETDREERLTIDRRPFRIERIDFWRDVEQQRSTGDEQTNYSVAEYRVQDVPNERQTWIFVDVPHAPLTAFELRTTTRNFSRRAAVQVQRRRGSQSTWQPLVERVVSRIDFKDLQREELEMAFSESRAESYRIVIDNRDSPPLDITGVEAQGNVYELLFLAAAGRSYQLVYGADSADAAQYDTAAIQAVIDAGFEPARAELGQQRGLDPPSAAGGTWRRLVRDPRLLIGVIVLLVIALGLAIYAAVRRLDSVGQS